MLHLVFDRISGQEYLLVVDTGSVDLVPRCTIFIPSVLLTDPTELPWLAYDTGSRLVKATQPNVKTPPPLRRFHVYHSAHA